MRPVQIYDKPPLHPFVCIKCGSSHDREHFVDLGIDTEMKNTGPMDQMYYTEGTIYFCSRCMVDLLRVYTTKIWDFILSKEDAHAAGYKNAGTELTLLRKEVADLRDIINRKDIDIIRMSHMIENYVEKSLPVGTDDSANALVDDLLGAENGRIPAENSNTGEGESTPELSVSDATGHDSESEHESVSNESSSGSASELIVRDIFATT